MSTITLHLSKTYDIVISPGLLSDLPERLRPFSDTGRVALLTDENVGRLYGEDLASRLRTAGFTVFYHTFPAGEASKNMTVLSELLEFLAAESLHRNDLILALGGGVAGDLCGLLAALYQRGTRVIQIPTTLLAMVDSSVGGKTAVDLRNGKNMAGVFWQPSLVLCDPEVLATLTPEAFAEGMAEVIKCGLIRRSPVLSWIREGTVREHLQEIIRFCVALKGEVAEQDETDEKGIRNILNVGHTAAHALEKMSHYALPHGRAVAMGLLLEGKLSEKEGFCSAETFSEIREAVAAVFGEDFAEETLKARYWDRPEFLEAMMSDKKNRGTGIVFELPFAVGDCRERVLFGEKEKQPGTAEA